MEVLIKTKPNFIDKLLSSLVLKQASFPDYECALDIFGYLTNSEGGAITILIEKGLLDCLADTLKLSESECESLMSKALWVLSNIASDTEENIDRLVKTEAFELSIPLALQSNNHTIRMNAMYIITGLIQFGNSQLALDTERRNPQILQALIKSLTTHSNINDLLKNLLEAIDQIFKLDTEYPGPAEVIAPVIARFLE